MPHGKCERCGKTFHGWALYWDYICECGGVIEIQNEETEGEE